MRERIDEKRLAEIQRRADAASPGPWLAEQDGFDVTCDHKPNGEYTVVIQGRVDEDYLRTWGDVDDNNSTYTLSNGHDREFIANARQDVPDLVAEVKAQSDRIRQLEEVLREARQKLEIYQPHVSNFKPFSYCQLIEKIDAALKGDPR